MAREACPGSHSGEPAYRFEILVVVTIRPLHRARQDAAMANHEVTNEGCVGPRHHEAVRPRGVAGHRHRQHTWEHFAVPFERQVNCNGLTSLHSSEDKSCEVRAPDPCAQKECAVLFHAVAPAYHQASASTCTKLPGSASVIEVHVGQQDGGG